MNLTIETLNLWGARALDFAWPVLWQSSLLIGLLFALEFVLRRKVRAAVRYALWLVVLLKLVLPPALALPTGLSWWLRPAKAAPAAPPPMTFTVTYGPSVEPSMPEPAPALPAAAAITPVGPALTLAAWALMLSSGVSLGLLGWMLLRWRQVARDVRQAETAPQPLQEMLEEARCGSGLRRPVRLGLTERPMSPAVCGLFRPTILLPRSLAERLAPAQLRAVLLHELAHLRRGDVWVNCAQALLQVAYWWHPLLWLANARIRQAREEAVDDAVMAALREEAPAYAPTLLEVARLALQRPLTSLGLVGILESRSSLRQRIQRLLEFHPPRKAGLTLASALLVLGFAALAVPMGEAPTPADATKPQTAAASTNTPASSSAPAAPQAQSSRLKAEAAQLYLSGQFDPAAAKLKQALALSPTNQAAWSLSNQVAKVQADEAAGLNRHSPINIKVKFIQVPEAEVTALHTRFPGTNAPGNGTWSTLLSPEQLREQLHQLDRTEGADVLAAPEVTTLSGRQCQMKVTDLTNVVVFDRSGLERVTETKSTFSILPQTSATPHTEQIEVGNMFYTLPLLEADGLTVHLETIITAMEFLGYTNPPDGSSPFPQFRTRQLCSTSSVSDGQTLVLDSTAPAGATSQRKHHVLVFITPRLIGAAGNPLHQEEALRALGQSKLRLEAHIADFSSRPLSANGVSSGFATLNRPAAKPLTNSPVSHSTTNAAVIERKLSASRLVHDGMLLYQMGKLDEAQVKLREASKLDPQNQAAYYYLNLVAEARYHDALNQRDIDSRERLQNVEREWALTGNGRRAILEKLNTIKLDEVRCDSLSLSEVVINLNKQIKERDPEKRGINFIINPNVWKGAVVDPSAPVATDPATGLPVDISTALVKLSQPLTKVTVEEALNAIVKAANMPIKYSLEDDAVVFSHKGAEPPRLSTRRFKVDPNTFVQGLQGVSSFTFGATSSGMGSGGGGGRNGGGNNSGNSSGGLNFLIRTNATVSVSEMARAFFKTRGVTLNPPKSIFFNDREGRLYVKAEEQDLNTIEEVIQQLNSAPAGNVPPAAPEAGAPGFPGFLGMTNASRAPSAPAAPAAGTHTTSTAAATTPPLNLQWFLGPTNASPVTNASAQIHIQAAFLELPEAVAQAFLARFSVTNAPGSNIWSTTLTPAQAAEARAQWESGANVTVLASPEATLLSGRLCRMKYVDLNTVVTGFTNGVPQTLTVELGPVLECTPALQADGYTIKLNPKFSLFEFLGYTNGYASPAVRGQSPGPEFRHRELFTSNSAVRDGQTLVLGGLVSEQVTRIKDKVPVLGDIPVVGKFFRSQSTSTRKARLVILITPTLVSPEGFPVHPEGKWAR